MDLLPQIIEQIFSQRKVNGEYRFLFDKFVETDTKLRKNLDKDLLSIYEQSCNEHDDMHDLEITQAIQFTISVCRNIFLQQPIEFDEICACLEF